MPYDVMHNGKKVARRDSKGAAYSYVSSARLIYKRTGQPVGTWKIVKAAK
jgi:hypothetical protein